MTLFSSILNALIAYGTCQAFFIAFVVLKSPKRTVFKRLFSALLIIEGIILFERLLVETTLINATPHVLGIAYPISFLKPPLLFLMALSITKPDFRLSQKDGWHSLPFLLILAINIPFYPLSGEEKLEMVTSFMNEIPSYKSFGFYFTLSFFVYIGIYVVKSLKTLNTFKKEITNNTLVNWYRTMLLWYSGFLIIHLVYFIIQPLGQLNFGVINQLSMLAMTFIIQAIAFKLIDQSNLFNTKTPVLGDPEERKNAERLILKKLEEDKIYLDEELTLERFAGYLNLKQHQISVLINQKFGCSYKKLIKMYRLAEAKKILENSDQTTIRLIDVAHQSGFSNKVSFHRVFKEFENMSPSEYLKKLENQKKG
ncbi:MAG: AraC family transcriptional regulator [Bacteroidota bacterium]